MHTPRDAEENKPQTALTVVGVIGLGLLIWGIVDLCSVGGRNVEVAAYNVAVKAWTEAARASFVGSSFNVSVNGNPLALAPSDTGSVQSLGHSIGEGDLDDYTPLQYIYVGTAAAIVMNNSLTDKLHIKLSTRDSDGQTSTLAVPLTVPMTEEHTMQSNEKVCKSEHGTWRNGRCVKWEKIQSLCFVVSNDPSDSKGFRFDTARRGVGCFPKFNEADMNAQTEWLWSRQAVDHTVGKEEEGEFKVQVAVISDKDPYIEAESVRGGLTDLQSQPSTNGWLLVVFGCCLIVAAVLPKIVARCDEKGDDEQELLPTLPP